MEPKEISLKDIIKAIKEADKLFSAPPEFKYIVIGSSSTVAFEGAVKSRDVDIVFPKMQWPKREDVKLRIGKGSEFNAQNQFYVEALDEVLISHLPDCWEKRAKTLPIEKIRAVALHPLDVTMSVFFQEGIVE